ncbi:hypothetical protein QOZ80_6BG0483070 [Eleusine coracana subsp. coracana]|nr:hypothetical protein QOZ80_6BG0483070 [Eleusine coracana subsp. coracana]
MTSSCSASTSTLPAPVYATTSTSTSSTSGFDYNYSTKAIAIGGGTVGWVDLWRGILLCDVLADSHRLRYVALPPPPPIMAGPLKGPPSYGRDIVAVDGEVRYFHMHCFFNDKCPYVIDSCEARTMILSRDYLSWEEDCSMRLSMDDVTDRTFADVLRGCQDDDGTSLMRYNVGYPALSLHQDVVYVTNKLLPRGRMERRAWVVAVDMRRQTRHGDVGYFCSGRPLASYYNFLQSGISQHLDMSTSW